VLEHIGNPRCQFSRAFFQDSVRYGGESEDGQVCYMERGDAINGETGIDVSDAHCDSVVASPGHSVQVLSPLLLDCTNAECTNTVNPYDYDEFDSDLAHLPNAYFAEKLLEITQHDEIHIMGYRTYLK
jgi:hypothetical protein